VGTSEGSVNERIRLWTFLLALAAAPAAGRGTRSGQAIGSPQPDSAFAVPQSRGETRMGVNQYTAAHVFEDLPDGGGVVLDGDTASDSAGIARIRQHTRDVAAAFQAGDFTKPFPSACTRRAGHGSHGGSTLHNQLSNPRSPARCRSPDPND
jgi:hypothetical protein